MIPAVQKTRGFVQNGLKTEEGDHFVGHRENNYERLPHQNNHSRLYPGNGRLGFAVAFMGGSDTGDG